MTRTKGKNNETVARRKRDILEFITKYHQEHGCAPTRRELAREFDYSEGSLATHYIYPLIDAGWLKHIPNAARGIVPARPWWEYPVEGEDVGA